MPAHSRPIGEPTCRECHKPATCHVFNTWNADLGPQCTRCATRTIARLHAEEARQAARYHQEGPRATTKGNTE